MILKLPRWQEFDLDSDFTMEQVEEMVTQDFEEYVKDASWTQLHRYQLSYIDLIVEYINNTAGCQGVYELMHKMFDESIRKDGEIPNESKFYSFEFMKECYRKGMRDHSLCRGERGRISSPEDDLIHQVMCHAIKAVLNWEPKR